MCADVRGYFCNSRNERAPGARDTDIGIYRCGEGIYHLESNRHASLLSLAKNRDTSGGDSEATEIDVSEVGRSRSNIVNKSC